MKIFRLLIFIWAVFIIVDAYSARLQGFTGLACIALAAFILNKVELK